jgi:hypothetical protein
MYFFQFKITLTFSLISISSFFVGILAYGVYNKKNIHSGFLFIYLFIYLLNYFEDSAILKNYKMFSGDVPRVNGQLAVARAFGDQSLKAHLSSEPDVRHVPIDSSIEFVILASDGLWKVSYYGILWITNFSVSLSFILFLGLPLYIP